MTIMCPRRVVVVVVGRLIILIRALRKSAEMTRKHDRACRCSCLPVVTAAAAVVLLKSTSPPLTHTRNDAAQRAASIDDPVAGCMTATNDDSVAAADDVLRVVRAATSADDSVGSDVAFIRTFSDILCVVLNYQPSI